MLRKYTTVAGEKVVYRYPQQRYQKKYRENHKIEIQKANRKWIEENYEWVLFTNARRRAKRINVPFDLESTDIRIPERCPVLGILIKRGTKANQDSSPTIDRLVPEKGYVQGNVEVISSLANRIKTNATREQIEKVVEWLKKKGL